MHSSNRACSNRRTAIAGVLLATLLLGAASAPAATKKQVRALQKMLAQQTTTTSTANVADLHVVDCLLPGQVRTLGKRTYLAPRRPTKTTARDCELKGGEYVAFDRADYRTALKVWMAAAQAGDAEAQTNVAEIYERGLGGEPNYAAALLWYEKAANQGNTRAQFNLGTMHEQGLGVPANQLTALNWYRQAWGLPEDDVVFASAARREQQALAQRLAEQINERDEQIEALEAQLDSLRASLEAATSSNSQTRAQLDTLKTLVDSLREQQTAQRLELDRIPLAVRQLATTSQSTAPSGLREPEPEQASALVRPPATPQSYRNLELGNYYALLIGNAQYESLEQLVTPLNDIDRARRVLEDKYGFTVFTLNDSNNVAMMQAINDLSEILTPEDNLLLFYAGHGSRLQAGSVETGYWLPRNAERPPRNTYWVPNQFVTGHLARLQAKRVLVVADSCYAGLLSEEPSMLLLGADAPQYANPEFLKYKLSKRSRLLLSSGGDRPVLDEGGDGHSVFASAFLDELESNSSLLASPELFLRIRDRVEASAQRVGFDQRPELKTIKAAGHEVGDFFFVPRSS
ncbi:MAG: caspase family protein [Pseudomonadota bacterium]